MANKDTPFGLKPVCYKSGAPYNGACNAYSVASGYATAMFVGDAVIKVAGGSNAAAIEGFPIGTLPDIERATVGDGNAITGVVVGFGPNRDNLSNIYSPASTENIVWVADDPALLFEIQADGAIPAASIGLNAVLIDTHSGSTTTGLSGTELDTTSDAPAADASNQLTIVRAVAREDNDTTLTHAKVLVRINNHTEVVGAIGI